MPRVDERIDREVERLSEAVDRTAALDAIRRKKARQRIRRRLRATFLAAATAAVTVAGFLGLSRLFAPGPAPFGPGGSPASRGLIAVASQQRVDEVMRGRPTFEIHVMNADGTGLRNLSPDEAQYLSPSWSPDGRRLAVVRIDRGDQGADEAIHVMNADGTGLTRVSATGLPAQSILQVRWSPDGRRLGFVRMARPTGAWTEADAAMQLVVVGVDGTGIRELTDDRQQVHSFDWSPDGSRIVFTRQYPVGERRIGYDLYVMNADGSGVLRLTDNGRSRDPDWSPDGTRIAFVGWGPDDDPPAGDIYVMAADGSGRLRLTDDPDPEYYPTWSPDGGLLAFSRVPAQGPCELIVRPPDDAAGPAAERVVVSEDVLRGCPTQSSWQLLPRD